MRSLTAPAGATGFMLASIGAADAAETGLRRSVEWSWDWWVPAGLAIAALCYADGYLRLRRRLGAARIVGRFEAGTFTLGLGTIFFALESPIDSISDQLFCVHMVQHLLLMLAAAPLLVSGRPAVAFLWAFPAAGRKRIGRVWTGLWLHRGVRSLMHPVVVWGLFYGVFVLWHFPALYQAAVENDAIHAGEHSSFLITALMFWSIVIEPSGRRRLGYGATFLFIVSTAVLSGLPGALLALAPRPLYPIYAAGTAAWGLTQLEDQQLAGVVMWIPGGLVYVVVAAAVFLKWLQQGGPAPVGPARRAIAAPLLAMCVLPLLPLGACHDGREAASTAIGDPERGVALIRSYGCGSCHTVPGVANADGLVGPPLNQIGRRIYLAGLLRNTPDNMVVWLRNPQGIVPGNVMPDMGLSDRDAHDMAAYLYTLQ